MKLLLYSLQGLLWQQMNAAGNLITFLSAPLPFRRQCRSQQHFLLILQVARKMSNSPPEGLTRAFHLSHETLFKYLEGLLVFPPSISKSACIHPTVSGAAPHGDAFSVSTCSQAVQHSCGLNPGRSIPVCTLKNINSFTEIKQTKHSSAQSQQNPIFPELLMASPGAERCHVPWEWRHLHVPLPPCQRTPGCRSGWVPASFFTAQVTVWDKWEFLLCYGIFN